MQRKKPIVEAAQKLSSQMKKLIETVRFALSDYQKAEDVIPEYRHLDDKFPCDGTTPPEACRDYRSEVTATLVSSTLDLARYAQKIANETPDLTLGNFICLVAGQHVRSATRLGVQYKTTTLNVHCPLCRRQLSVAVKDTETSLYRVVTVASKLFRDRTSLETFLEPAKESQQILNRLHADIRIWTNSESRSDAAHPSLESPLEVIQRAKILGKATADVINAVRTIYGDSKPVKEKNRLVDVALTLTGITSDMVRHGKMALRFQELRKILESIRSDRDYVAKFKATDFYILKKMGRSAVTLSKETGQLAREVSANRDATSSLDPIRDSISLINSTKMFVVNIKNTTVQPHTTTTYKQVLGYTAAFIEEAERMMDSFANILASLSRRS